MTFLLNLELPRKRSWYFKRLAIPLVVLLAIFAVIVPSYAFEFDQEQDDRYLQGYWWQGRGTLFLDAGQGGWVFNGQSTTSRNTSLTYVYARSRGLERCVGVVTDTNWDQEAWSSSLAAVYGAGSGYSSMGNCSIWWFSPCKTFETNGDHRADYGGYYDTTSTDPWIIEPVC